jgi:hypothetical protein
MLLTHPVRKSHSMRDLMNIAMDHVINAILIESKLGEFKKGEWIHDPQIATAKDSVIDTYAKLYKMA